MTYTKDPRIDAYIDALPTWQQAVCRKLRKLVHAADRDVNETIKRTNRPYFVLQGNICALLAAKDHVNIFLYDGAIVPIPRASSPPGTTTRPLALWRSARVKRSTRRRLPPCSSKLLPTTTPAAGAS